MTASRTRLDLMDRYKRLAKMYDERHDVVLRKQASDHWHELATDAEARRAPQYLTWSGRKG